jgi:hypothetical protein
MAAIEIREIGPTGFVAEVIEVLASGRDGGVLHQTPAFDDPDLAEHEARRWIADHERSRCHAMQGQ